MLIGLIIFFLFVFTLFIVFYRVNVKKRKKLLNSEDKQKLVTAKKKLKIKAVLFKLIPILLVLLSIVISSICIYKSNHKEQSRFVIYKNNEPYYQLTDYEVYDNIKNQIRDVAMYGIIIWCVLDIVSYIIFVSRIRKDKKLDEKEAEILVKYYSGRMTYKLLGGICIILLTIFIFYYVFPATRYL